MAAYDVYLTNEDGARAELIDTVFYTGYDDVEEVRQSLINHDGYDSRIVVVLATDSGE